MTTLGVTRTLRSLDQHRNPIESTLSLPGRTSRMTPASFSTRTLLHSPRGLWVPGPVQGRRVRCARRWCRASSVGRRGVGDVDMLN